MKLAVATLALSSAWCVATSATAQFTSSLDPSLPNYSPTVERPDTRGAPKPDMTSTPVRPRGFVPVMPNVVVVYPPIPHVPVPKAPEAQFAQCAGNSDAATPDAMLAACSAIIAAGRESGARLAEVYANRGRAWHANAQFNAAIGDFDQAIRLAPQNVVALHGRCMSRAVVGQLVQALADCDQALKLKPDDLAAREARGFTYRKMRDFDRSIADYDAVLQVEPKRASALFGRGVARTDAGDRSGYNDINQAKSMQSGVAQEFGRYGVFR